MVMQYASIQDAWDQSVYPKSKPRSRKSKVDASCDLLAGGCEDKSQVMNTYFDDIPFDKYEKAYKATHREKKERRVDIVPKQSCYDVTDNSALVQSHKRCKEEVQPYGMDEYDHSYGYDQYYETEPETEAEMPTTCASTAAEEESPSISHPLKEALYRDMILENYEEKRASGPGNTGWMELAIYIFSGIILIIMMEQILSLGLYLK